ncbi:MAG: hypothetical protein AAFR14_09245, partial [Bacteroidota bacterium]
MKKYDITFKQILGDTNTLVGIYLKLRDRYGQVQLLETSSYATREGSLSFIAFGVESTLQVTNGILDIDGQVKSDFDIVEEVKQFMSTISISGDQSMLEHMAILGYSGYDAVQHFETINFDPSKESESIPELRYDFYRHMIVMDHFHETVY